MIGNWSFDDLIIRYQSQERYCHLLKQNKYHNHLYRRYAELCNYIMANFGNILNWLSYESPQELIDIAEHYIDLLQEQFGLEIEYLETLSDYDREELYEYDIKLFANPQEKFNDMLNYYRSQIARIELELRDHYFMLVDRGMPRVE